MRTDRWPPAQQCEGVSTRSGERCQGWAIRGGRHCPKHGGLLPNLQAEAERNVEAARTLLQVWAREVAEALVTLALDPEQPAYVRVAATRVALDRAGVGPTSDVAVTLGTSELGASAGDVVRERLRRLAEGLPAEAIDSAPRAFEGGSASS